MTETTHGVALCRLCKWRFEGFNMLAASIAHRDEVHGLKPRASYKPGAPAKKQLTDAQREARNEASRRYAARTRSEAQAARQAAIPLPEHGTSARYRSTRPGGTCRCEPCVEAYTKKTRAKYEKRQQREKAARA